MTRNRFVYFLLLVIGLYLVVSLSRSIYFLSQKTKDIEDAQIRVEEDIKNNTKLNRELIEIQSPEFIEKQAREKLNMSRPKETVVVIPKELIEQTASQTATYSASFFNRPEEIPNWKKWWNLFWGDNTLHN